GGRRAETALRVAIRLRYRPEAAGQGAFFTLWPPLRRSIVDLRGGFRFMTWAGIAKFLRRPGALLPALVLCAAPAAAQYGAPTFSPPPNAHPRSPACLPPPHPPASLHHRPH